MVIVCFTSHDWITASRRCHAVFTTCCYGSWAPLIGFCCFFCKRGNPLYYSATLPIYPVCVWMHTDGFAFQNHLAVPKYDSKRHWGAEKPKFRKRGNGAWCFATQSHGGALKFRGAAEANSSESTGAGDCVQGGTREFGVHVSRWVNHYGDSAQAVSFSLATVGAEGEKAAWRVAACNYHGSVPRLDWTLTQPSTETTATNSNDDSRAVLEFVTVAASSPLSEARRLSVHSMPEWLIALEEQGPAKPRGSSTVLQSEAGGGIWG